MSHDWSPPRQLTQLVCLGDSTNIRWREASSTPYVTDLLSLRMSIRSVRSGAEPAVISSASKHQPAHFLQQHPVVAAPRHRLPMGNHGTECYLSKCPERSAGQHRPSATMETDMRYQADIDALRLRRHWQLSPPGSLSGLTCRRWRLPAAHQMRPPCNGQLGRYCRRDANWATQPSQLQ